jgi:branched-chain amino acid transport system substrate-binding protein
VRLSSWRKTFVLGTLTLAGAAAAIGCAATRGPIRLGLAGPFTDPVGRPMRLAAELAIEEINRDGGIAGRPLELVAYDDYGDPDSAVAVAERLYDAGVSAVVGHLWSSTTIVAAPVYNGGSDPVAAVSPSSSSPEVSGLGDWTFRVCPSDLSHGKALAAWARNRLGLRRATVFYLNDSYGRGIRQSFVREFERLGGEVVANNPYLGDRPEVGPFLDRLARDGRSEFVFVAGNRSEGEAILRQAAARGIALPLLGADGLEGIEAAGGIANGVYQSSAYLPSIESPANRRFVAAWRAKYPRDGAPNQPAAATYDAVRLIAETLRESGDDRADVREALARRTAERPFDGVTGRLAFDAQGDVPEREVYIAVVEDGALKLAGQE